MTLGDNNYERRLQKLFWDKNITILDSAVRYETELFVSTALAEKKKFDSLQINQLAEKGNTAEK
jgi:hypothetical protein